MKNLIIVACVSVLFSAGASAGDVFSRGAYVGGMLGASEFDDDGAFSDLEYDLGIGFDDSDVAFGVYGGYRFFKYLSVEGRLSYLGNFTLKDDFDSIDIDAAALTANVVGIIPFGESGWELYGQLGIGGIHFEFDEDYLDGTDEVVGTAGVGIRFTPIRNLSIALGIDAYAWESDSNYDPYIGVTQFSVQYNFARNKTAVNKSTTPVAMGPTVTSSPYIGQIESVGQSMMCNQSYELIQKTGENERWKLDCGGGKTMTARCIDGTCYIQE